ncbi:MAG: Kazal-type serine protease inhibitor family protein [Oligoflexia bacterium]
MRPERRPDAPQVCGSNGQTYRDSCTLMMAQCKDSKLKMLYEGPCATPKPTTQAPVNNNKPWCGTTAGGDKVARRELLSCRPDAPKVCGSDGKTYANSCTLMMAQCEDPKLTLVKEGAC